MIVTIERTQTHYGSPQWLVQARDGRRDWADSYFDREDAEQVAADIEQGILDPWEDD
jgi:hypothetical protein